MPREAHYIVKLSSRVATDKYNKCKYLLFAVRISHEITLLGTIAGSANTKSGAGIP